MTSSLEEADRLVGRVLGSSDLSKANVLYTRILKLDPHSSYGYCKWALQLLKQRQYSKAKQKFKRSIQISPNNVNLYDEWCERLYYAREFEEVIILAERYPDKFRLPYNVQNTKGICYLHLGDYDNAIKCFQKAISMKDDSRLTRFNWALALYLQGKREEALEMCEKARQFDFFPQSIYRHEVSMLDEDVKRDEGKIFEELIKKKIEGFEFLIRMNETKEKIDEDGE